MIAVTASTSKVGDTLTATVEPADAIVSYEWLLNGTVVDADESFEVPASAKDGDEIKVVVENEDGETAEDTVYVGGLTILEVEPTTAGASNGTGFKYIRATFSKALDELAPSQIEIRRKSDKQLYSVESVVLSSDGTFADITLFGDSSSAGTYFLQAGPIYTMKITQDGEVATLDFELPAYNTEAVVTSVDMAKNKITVTYSGKTQKPVVAGTYNVANKFDGNLGALVGRAVTFDYDSDSNMTSFNLLDQKVVYGTMKSFIPNGDDMNSWYYKDAITGEKYYCKYYEDATASIRGTLWISAAGDEDNNPYYIADEKTFSYVKLVLNPDGTIATATIEKDLPNTLYVKDIDGTIVTQDDNNAFDLDGYTIVSDSDYITVDDLAEGDILFLNTTNKFAEVYVNEVSGTISNIIDGKLSINDKAYEWYGAQYWDEADSKFVELAVKGDPDTDRAKSQLYLESLDTEEDTTIYLGRDGKIKYIEATPIEEVVTTTRELITGVAKGYTQSLENHIRIPAFDGTDSDTIDVTDSSIKTMFGDKGKVTWANAGAADTDVLVNSTIAFEDKDDDAPATDYDFTATKTNVVFPNKKLVDVVRNEAGEVTGFKPLNYTIAGTLSYTDVNIATIDGKAYNDATASDITSSTKKITAGGKTLSLGSYTNIWYHYTKADGTIEGSKWTLDEFPSAALASAANTYLVYSDGTKATDIVVIGTEANPTIKTGNTTSYSGIIVGNTKKVDSNGKNKVNTVKMILTDGTTQTFDVSEDAVIATWNDDGDGKVEVGTDAVALTIDNNKYFATVVVQDNDDKVVQITVATSGVSGAADSLNGWTDNTDFLKPDRAKTSSKLTTDAGKELTVTDNAALLLKYSEEGSTKFKAVTFAEINTTETIVNVWYHTNYDDAASKIEADMIIVEDTGIDALPSAVTTVAVTGTAGATADGDSITINPNDLTETIILTPTNADAASFAYAWSHSDGAAVAGSPATAGASSTAIVNRVGTYTCVVSSVAKDGYDEIADVTVTIIVKKVKIAATDFKVTADIALTTPSVVAAGSAEAIGADKSVTTAEVTNTDLHTATFTSDHIADGTWEIEASGTLPAAWTIVDNELNFKGAGSTESISLKFTVTDNDLYEGTATILFTMTDDTP